MRVADILEAKGHTVITIHADAPLASAVEIMHAKTIGALVVLDGRSNIVGLIDERTIISALARKGMQAPELYVQDVMNRHVVICHPEDTLKKVAAWMAHHGIKYLPVLVDGKLTGIVSMSDVIRVRMQEVETEANVLRELFIASH